MERRGMASVRGKSAQFSVLSSQKKRAASFFRKRVPKTSGGVEKSRARRNTGFQPVRPAGILPADQRGNRQDARWPHSQGWLCSIATAPLDALSEYAEAQRKFGEFRRVKCDPFPLRSSHFFSAPVREKWRAGTCTEHWELTTENFPARRLQTSHAAERGAQTARP